MTYINITNDDATEFDYDEDFTCENVDGLYHLLNTREIGIMIAYQLFDAEYDITQEILDEEINDYLSDIHEKIIEAAIETLEENNREVL